MLRFTFCVGRYGEDILGGVENHARSVAEHLVSAGHDVRVLTTTARSYATWKSELPAGGSRLGGVEVVRFRPRHPRLRPFDELTKLAAGSLRSVHALARAWAIAQGPVVPDLLAQLVRDARDRDLVVFFSLLSHPTFEGLRLVGKKSVLVPVVHEEPPIYTRLARETLALPRALFVNTEEEWARIARVASPSPAPGAVVAVGMDEPPARDPHFVSPVRGPYVLLVGRAAKSRPLVATWRALHGSAGALEVDGTLVPYRDVKLVTIGERSPLYEGVPNVVQLGWVDDATRWQVLRNAVALIQPSKYESLSLVLLEAWACHVPTIVHAACDVTVGQARRSGGGIAVDFDDPSSAARAIEDALKSAARRRAMGDVAAAWTRDRYRWDRVVRAYEAVAEAVRDEADVQTALAGWAPS